MKPLTETDLQWLENRVGKKRWTPEDCGRILADLRAERDGTAGMYHGPALSVGDILAQLHGLGETKC